MSSRTETALVQTWTARLSADAEGLDLGDAEDRAIFRGRVLSATAWCKHTALCQISAALGGPARAPSRSAISRAIADAWIARAIAA